MSRTRWWLIPTSLVFAISLGSCLDEEVSSKAPPPVGVVELACQGDPGPGDDDPGQPEEGTPDHGMPGVSTPCLDGCASAETACRGGANDRRDECVDDCPTRAENEACKADCLVNCKQGSAKERASCRKDCGVACPEGLVRQCPRTCRRTWREEVRACEGAGDTCIDSCKAPLQPCRAQRSICFDAAREAFDVCEGACVGLDADGQGSESCLHACFTAQLQARRDCREEMRICVDVLSRDADGDGATPYQGDCDDADSTVFPGTGERCDGADDDCDGATDEGVCVGLCTDGCPAGSAQTLVEPGAGGLVRAEGLELSFPPDAVPEEGLLVTALAEPAPDAWPLQLVAGGTATGIAGWWLEPDGAQLLAPTLLTIMWAEGLVAPDATVQLLTRAPGEQGWSPVEGHVCDLVLRSCSAWLTHFSPYFVSVLDVCDPPCPVGSDCKGGLCLQQLCPCPEGAICVDGVCAPDPDFCDPPCPVGWGCSAGSCMPPVVECLPACPYGDVCIAGACQVDDAQACGGCPGGAACVGGRCVASPFCGVSTHPGFACEDRVEDRFDDWTNPTGSWSFGWDLPSLGIAFSPMAQPWVSGEAPELFGWVDAAMPDNPIVFSNGSDQTVHAYGSITMEPGWVALHPGCALGERAVLRWTAPVDGSFVLEYRLSSANGRWGEAPLATTDLSFTVNGQTFQATPFAPASPDETFMWPIGLALEAGSTVDLTVGPGEGGCYHDATRVEARVNWLSVFEGCNPLSASPEVCDGRDNDCNGVFDDPAPAAASCPVGSACAAGACQQQPCPCPIGAICVNDLCEPEPIPCLASCPLGWSCDTRVGLCREPVLACLPTCWFGQVCVDGQCVGDDFLACDPRCPPGAHCVDEQCHANPDCGVSTRPGFLCGDRVEDHFPDWANPAGAWTVGWRNPALGVPFTPSTETFAPGIPGLFGWNNSGAGGNSLAVSNGSEAPLDAWGLLAVEPAAVVLHPGSEGQQAVLRWTAVVPGSYVFEVRFSSATGSGCPAPGATPDIALLVNGTAYPTGYLNAAGWPAEMTWAIGLGLEQGAVVDLVVGLGPEPDPDGWQCEATRVQAKVDWMPVGTGCNPLSAAPETCNGLDDDCDGAIDGPAADGSCEDGSPCTAESCSGEACLSMPLPDGQPCDAGGHPGVCDAGVCARSCASVDDCGGASLSCADSASLTTAVCAAGICRLETRTCASPDDPGAFCDAGACRHACAGTGDCAWDLATDFSPEDATPGDWSFGWATSPGNYYFLPLLVPYQAPEHPLLHGWTRFVNPGFETQATLLYRNDSGEVQHPAGTTTVQPGWLVARPGDNGQQVLVRWTAPAPGRYKVQGLWQGVSDGELDWQGNLIHRTTVRGTVALNAVDNPDQGGGYEPYVIWMGLLNLGGYGNEASFEDELVLEQGDTLDFAVDYFGYYFNCYLYLHTRLDVQLEALAPESP